MNQDSPEIKQDSPLDALLYISAKYHESRRRFQNVVQRKVILLDGTSDRIRLGN